MKKVFKNHWVRFSIFAIIMAIILVCLDIFVFTTFYYGNTYEKFYAEEENTLDLVSIGNSTVRNGIIPGKIWHDYGITSYNMIDTPIHMEVICIVIDEIARLQNPKVVYIDLFGLTDQKIADKEYFITKYVNSMPDCDTKTSLIEKYDFLEKSLKEQNNKKQGIKLFANHNNFRNQEYVEMVFYGSSMLEQKGFAAFYNAQKQKPYNFDMTTVLELPDDGKYYLNKLMETCKKYPEITFVFGKMPRCLNETTVNDTYMLRSAIPTIEENGYTYIEWEDMFDEIGFDYNTDFMDKYHMNINGAKKFTKFYTEYLIENYGLTPTEKSESVIQNFDECYNNYLKCVKR